jgi:hypothetical protein
MGNNSGNGFGFSIGGSGGGGGTNTNIANADLTSDGNHTLDVVATTLTIDNAGDNIAQFNGSTKKVVFGPSGDDYTFPDERPTTAGHVLSAADTSGTLEWAAQTDTNTNIGNTNLSVSGTRALDLGANTLTVQSGVTNVMKLNGAADTVSIGGTNPYVMPTSSGLTAGAVIQSNNATGRTGFVRGGFNIPFTMYIQGMTDFSDTVDSPESTWHYPEPMSNNKFLALIRSSSIPGASNVVTDWDQLTSTTLRSCTLGGTTVPAVCDSVNAWVSVLDNTGGSNLTPTVTLEILAFSPLSGETTQLLPTKLLSITSTQTGDSNNKFYNIKNGTQGVVAVPIGAMIMPILKLSIEGEAETKNFDVWLNGSAHFYLTTT